MMLHRGSNNRGAHGQTPNRSRGSRGRGSTSRGASSFSGKSNHDKPVPSGPRALQERTNTFRSNYNSKNFDQDFHRKQKSNYQHKGSKFNQADTSSNSQSENPFEQERQENAVKREQRGQNGVTSERGGRGSARGSFHNKQVRFSEPPEDHNGQNKGHSPTPSNPFAKTGATTTPTFGSPATATFNPFAAKPDPPANPFSASNGTKPMANPFGTPSQPNTSSVFGAPSGPRSNNGFSAAFGKQSTGVFGAPSTTASFGSTSTTPSPNPFAAPPNINGTIDSSSASNPNSHPPTTNPFGAPANGAFSESSSKPFGSPSTTFGAASNNPFFSSRPTSSPSSVFGAPSKSTFSGQSSKPTSSLPAFGAPSKTPFSGFSTRRIASPLTSFGSPAPSGFVPKKNGSFIKPFMNGTASDQKVQTQSKFVPAAPHTSSKTSGSALATKLDQHLRKQGINPPQWPTPNPGDPKEKDVIKSFWQTPLKKYREKVRASLIGAGYLDDPDKPKKLSEAIDFKGTCEDMCPEFEKFTRIVDYSVDRHEKDPAPDGSMWPSMRKMVKALARSAAGQDAPLPMDVRTPAALRRTLDYLMNTILGEDENLPKVHGFLWDRTRAIRRDFVFQQSSMNSSEMSDQIYCLERITRFHAIALHQMSREDFASEDFSEQQEVEQLGKSLLSLIHAYEDCKAQKIVCENEAEFRAYYVLFNSHNTAILETVQDWGYKFWRDSEEVKLAVSLVEALQNIWDARGPLKPYAATDIAHNAFAKFFSIIGSPDVSYTMACFAEIHFNSVRKAILKTILTSYRKQRDQTKDWTLSRLNAYLRFDDEADIVPFGEAYGLRFEEVDGDEYLSFDSEDAISDPFPPSKQRHSYEIVERKRGNHSLPEAIDVSVFEEEGAELGNGEAEEVEDDLFFKDDSATPASQAVPETIQVQKEKDAEVNTPVAVNTNVESQSPAPQTKPTSLFDRVSMPQTFGPDFFTQQPAAQPTVQQDGSDAGSPSIFSAQPKKKAPKFFTQTPPVESPKAQTPPTFTFLQPPSTTPAGETSQPPLIFGQRSVTEPASEDPRASPTLSSYTVTPPPAPSATTPSEQNKPSGPPLGQSPLPKPFFATSSTPQNPTSTLPDLEQPLIGDPKVVQPQPGSVEIVASQPALGSAKLPAAVEREKKFSGLTDWVALGMNGIIDQFTEYQVEQILMQTVKKFVKDEAKRAAKEADELAKKQADQFRYRHLATKYGNMWREGAHRLWQRRRGREVRQARREMAESLRASKAALSANLVEDFKASTRRRASLESLLDATGVLNGVHNANEQIREIVNPPKKRQRSEKSAESTQSTANRHKRGKSDNPLRRSLLSDPSYLSGESRIHLMSNYAPRDESRRQVSGVQTDYFRLKARGIATIPDGTALANSAAKNILHQKRSFDGITKPAATKPLKIQQVARSVPAKPLTHSERPRTSAERDEDIQVLKTRAKEAMSEDKNSRRKRSAEMDDEELFERAKRIREQMDEGSKWYRKQIDRDTASRSAS